MKGGAIPPFLCQKAFINVFERFFELGFDLIGCSISLAMLFQLSQSVFTINDNKFVAIHARTKL